MPRKRTRTGEMGDIEKRGGQYRAYILYYDEDGVRHNLRAPFRAERRQAEEDLTTMRAAGMAAEDGVGVAVEAVCRQAVMDAMAAVADQLKTKAAEERPVREAGAASSGSVAPSEEAVSAGVVVMSGPAAYKPYSGDAEEPWQTERRHKPRDEDAWLTVAGSTHDNPTLGLDRSTKRKLSKQKGFSAPGLVECKKLLQQFAGERAHAAQIHELLSILPAGTEHKLGIETKLIDGASDAMDTSGYMLLVDYRRRIADLVSCVRPAGVTKKVVLKVIESAWASDVAAGNKFFECVANKNCWGNVFKGLTAGDLFIVVHKGMLQVAAVGEIVAASRAKVADRDVLYLMLPQARHNALDTYLAEALTFDFVQFRKVYYPLQPLAARELLRRIGATVPAQWQGVVHVSTDEGSHTRLGELVEHWPSHNNDNM